MDVSSIPASTDVWGSPPVPAVPEPSEILCRPFLLHEAASLVATPDEWEVYMIVGRERGLLEALSPQLAEGTRFAMRRDLESTFWTRIVANLVAGRWRAVRVTPEEEISLGPYQATALANPFDAEIAANLAGTRTSERLVFQALAAEAPPHVRQQREREAIDYIRAWANNQSARPLFWKHIGSRVRSNGAKGCEELAPRRRGTVNNNGDRSQTKVVMRRRRQIQKENS